MKGINVIKKEHPVWKEYNREKDEELIRLTTPINPAIVSRWQYIYSSERGKISLIKLRVKEEKSTLEERLLQRLARLWEIYCLEGELFEDVERFETKREAEERIKELLEA